ncbi:MAG: heme-binding protein, partial [Verrucomicrobiota bacterium]
RDVLESILDPTKVVSEQYQNTTLLLANGDDVTGRIVEENNNKIVVVIDPLKQTQRELKKSEIKARHPSKVSPMPEGLVNILSKEEILDLVAYLESSGKSTAAAFIGGK